MIIEKKPKQKFLGVDPCMAKYFYFKEAPEDENSSEEDDEVVVSTRPLNIRKPTVDYTKDIPSEEETPEPTEDDQAATPEGDAAEIAEDNPPEPITVDADDIEPDDDSDIPEEDEPPAQDTGSDTEETDSADNNPEETPNEEEPSNDTADEKPPTTGDDEPATDDTPEAPSGDEVSVEPPGEDAEPTSDEDESNIDNELDDIGILDDDEDPNDPTDVSGTTRKYNLYRDFLALYNANKGYIEKLEHSRPDSLEATTVINSVLDKLRKIDKSMSEYMIIRFSEAPYLQSLVFFQQLIATIRLCFSLIRNNKPFLDQTVHIEDLIKPNRKSSNKH